MAITHAGGRTNHWGRVSLRNGPYDFKAYSRDGLGFDWPIAYEEMAPYYDKVELLIGVYGANDGLENTPHSSPGCLLPPPKPLVSDLLVAQRARKLGIPVIAGHRAVLTQQLDWKTSPARLHPGNLTAQRLIATDMQRRAACFWATPCVRGCSIRATYQSTTVHLPPALESGKLDIVTDAMVHEVTLGGNGQAKGVGFIDKTTGRHCFERICRAFQQAFVKADGTVGSGSQTSYILALKFNLLPESMRRRAAERLAADVRARGVSLTTGMLGTRFILEALTEAGFTDLAYGLLLRTEYPSWGYQVRQGATTVWESWDAIGKSRPSEGAAKVLHPERNHSDFATLSGFLFRRIAGIDAGTPGFETIVIRPALDPRVKSGGGDYDSILGRISTDWSQNADGSFSLNVRLPANTTARVHLPASLNARLQEGRREVTGREDLRLISRTDHEAVFEVGSGSYTFRVEG